MPSHGNVQIQVPLRSQGTTDLSLKECATLASKGPFVSRPRVNEIKGWREYESLGVFQWERHRATIKELYIDEGKRLKDVADIMRQNYAFNATIKMYKLRLNKWGYFKNNRKLDTKSESQTKKGRQAKGNLTNTLALATTRQPITLRDPDVYNIPGQIFSSISTYMWGSCDGQRWTATDLACATFYENAYFRPSAELLQSIGSLTSLLQEQKYLQAGPVMRRAAIQMETVLRDQPVDLLTCLLEIALQLHSKAPDLAALLMRHSADIAKVHFSSPKHPVRIFTQRLANLNSVELGALAAEAYACQLKIWQDIWDCNTQNAGDSNETGLVWITGLALAGGLDKLPLSLVPRLDGIMLRFFEAVKGSEWCTQLLQSTTANDQFQFFVGQSEGKLTQVTMQPLGTPTKVASAQPVARYSLAHLNAQCRHFAIKDRSAREAMEIQRVLQTEMGTLFIGMASALEGWLCEVGEYDKAASVVQYRERFLAAGLADVIHVT